MQSNSSVDFAKCFEGYGVSLQPASSNQSKGDCLFCGGDDKFYVNRDNGLWECKSCGEKGNLVVFIRKLWEMLSSVKQDYSSLMEKRRILNATTLEGWGLVQLVNGVWAIPGFNAEGHLVQLYKYVKDRKSGKHYWCATAGLEPSSGIHWYIPSNVECETIYVAEGVFDGMMLSEVLGKDSYILATPGCNTFLESWCSYFSGKEVVFLYDNDHPREVSIGKSIQVREPGSIAGVKRASSLLVSSHRPPKSISYLQWGENGYDPVYKTGYDLTDHFRQGATLASRKDLWLTLSQKIVPVPKEWQVEKTPTSINILPSTCTSWKELVNYWRKALSWPDPGEGLDYALSVIMAMIISTETQGEQIWCKLIAPPSSAKSILAEAICVAKKYTKAVSGSTIRSIYSGFKATKDEDEDNSLVPLIKGKTMVIKDGDPFTKSQNFEKVLGELRDIYDGVGRSHFNNRMGKDYEGYRFTLLICGTEGSMGPFDRSELGERFIDCVILNSMEEGVENEIGWRVVLRAAQEVTNSVNGVAHSLFTQEMYDAKAKTGGYVEYLRNNGDKLLKAIIKEVSSLRYCQYMGSFVSFMRTKQPLDKGKGHAEIKTQKELPFRLMSQYARLAICLAAAMGEKSLNERVMACVKKVGMDTSRGPTLNLCEQLYSTGNSGMEVRALAIILNESDEKIRSLLRFLRKIEIVQSFIPNSVHRMNKQVRWKLTDRIRRLYEIVVIEQEIVDA